MIVRDFLDWVRTAPASQRAEATSALARAYLYSDLSADDAAAAEGAMLMLLDDRFAAGAPRARRRAGGKSERAAGDHAGAGGRPAADRRAGAGAVAAVRRRRSGRCGGDRRRQRCRRRSPAAPDCRVRSPPPSPKSAPPRRAWCCWKIPTPTLRLFSIERIVERHGHLAAIREALLARDDVAAATRLTLVAKLSETLAGFVAERQWLDAGSCAAHRARGMREGDPGAGRAKRRRRKCVR